MRAGQAVNRVFDNLARTDVRVGGHAWPAFRVCGAAGIVWGVLLATALVAAQKSERAP